MTDPAAAQAATTTTAEPPAPSPTVMPQQGTPTEPQANGNTATDEAVAKLRADLDAANQRAERLQAESRKHEDRWKSRDDQLAQQAEILKLIAEKTGVEIDGKPDPAKLAEQLTAAQQQGKQAAVELAVYRAAAAAGANADLLLDSRAFMAKTGGLDPASADFAEQVKQFATDAVTANPTLAVVPPKNDEPPADPPPAPQLPASSGGSFGTPSASRQWTDADVERATPQELEKAIEQGLLAHMGIAPPRKGRRR